MVGKGMGINQFGGRWFPWVGIVFLMLAASPVIIAGLPAGSEAAFQGPNLDVSEDFGVTLMLEECVDRALKVNPELKGWRYELEKSVDDEKISRSSLGPSLSTSFTYNDINSIYSKGPADKDYLDQRVDTFDVALIQPLFRGFSSISRYQQSKLQSEWVAHNIALTEAKIALRAQIGFSKILQTRGNVKSLRNTEQRLRVVLKSTQAYHDVDMAPYVEVLQAGVDLADAVQLLSKVENELKTQIIQLNILVGLPPGQSVRYEGKLDETVLDFPMTEEQCLVHARDNRPDLIAARKNRAVAEKAVAIEAGRFYPTVDLEGHYTTRDRKYDRNDVDVLGNEIDIDQQNDYWTMGVNLRWTLFESGKNYYSHQKAKREVYRQKELVRTLEDQIHSEVRVQFANMNEAKNRIAVTRKFLAAAQENFDLANKRFELQVGTTQEVLDAQERLTTAEVERVAALFDHQQALANLYFAIGMRNDALNGISHPVTD